VPIAKDVYEGENVEDEEKRSRNPQSWNSYWILRIPFSMRFHLGADVEDEAVSFA
jgi:hypothetical protein